MSKDSVVDNLDDDGYFDEFARIKEEEDDDFVASFKKNENVQKDEKAGENGDARDVKIEGVDFSGIDVTEATQKDVKIKVEGGGGDDGAEPKAVVKEEEEEMPSQSKTRATKVSFAKESRLSSLAAQRMSKYTIDGPPAPKKKEIDDEYFQKYVYRSHTEKIRRQCEAGTRVEHGPHTGKKIKLAGRCLNIHSDSGAIIKCENLFWLEDDTCCIAFHDKESDGVFFVKLDDEMEKTMFSSIPIDFVVKNNNSIKIGAVVIPIIPHDYYDRKLKNRRSSTGSRTEKSTSVNVKHEDEEKKEPVKAKASVKVKEEEPLAPASFVSFSCRGNQFIADQYKQTVENIKKKKGEIVKLKKVLKISGKTLEEHFAVKHRLPKDSNPDAFVMLDDDEAFKASLTVDQIEKLQLPLRQRTCFVPYLSEEEFDNTDTAYRETYASDAKMLAKNLKENARRREENAFKRDHFEKIVAKMGCLLQWDVLDLKFGGDKKFAASGKEQTYAQFLYHGSYVQSIVTEHKAALQCKAELGVVFTQLSAFNKAEKPNYVNCFDVGQENIKSIDEYYSKNLPVIEWKDTELEEIPHSHTKKLMDPNYCINVVPEYTKPEKADANKKRPQKAPPTPKKPEKKEEITSTKKEMKKDEGDNAKKRQRPESVEKTVAKKDAPAPVLKSAVVPPAVSNIKDAPNASLLKEIGAMQNQIDGLNGPYAEARGLFRELEEQEKTALASLSDIRSAKTHAAAKIEKLSKEIEKIKEAREKLVSKSNTMIKEAREKLEASANAKEKAKKRALVKDGDGDGDDDDNNKTVGAGVAADPRREKVINEMKKFIDEQKKVKSSYACRVLRRRIRQRWPDFLPPRFVPIEKMTEKDNPYKKIFALAANYHSLYEDTTLSRIFDENVVHKGRNLLQMFAAAMKHYRQNKSPIIKYDILLDVYNKSKAGDSDSIENFAKCCHVVALLHYLSFSDGDDDGDGDGDGDGEEDEQEKKHPPAKKQKVFSMDNIDDMI